MPFKEFNREVEEQQSLIDELVEAFEAIIDECPNPVLPYAYAIVGIAEQALASAKKTV